MLKDRAEAHAILDGKRNPPPNRDYGNAHGNGYVFAYWAYKDIQRGLRKPLVMDSQPSATNPLFTWSALHKTLLSQMSSEDRRAFPEAKEELDSTLLFLNTEEGTFKIVRSRVPLQGQSVKFFEGLMLDFLARGWMDVLWLSRLGEEPPRELPPWEGVKLMWGAGMI